MLKAVAKKIIPQKVRKYIRKQQRRIKIINEWWSINRFWNIDQYEGVILLNQFRETDRMLGGLQYYSQVYQDMYLDNFVFNKKEGGYFWTLEGTTLYLLIILIFLKKIESGLGLHLNLCLR